MTRLPVQTKPYTHAYARLMAQAEIDVAALDNIDDLVGCVKPNAGPTLAHVDCICAALEAGLTLALLGDIDRATQTIAEGLVMLRQLRSRIPGRAA